MAQDYVSDPETERVERDVFTRLEDRMTSLDAGQIAFLQALSELMDLLGERIESSIAGGDDLYEVLVDTQRTQRELQQLLDRRADDLTESD